MTSAYIAGPMTNIPNFNFPLFDAIAALAREHGIEVSNPHEHDQEAYPGIDEAEATVTGNVGALAEEVGFSFTAAMQWDLPEVARCDHIIMLPGWEKSTGARTERFVAEMTGSEIYLALQSSQGWVILADPVQKRMTIPEVSQ